MTDVKKSRTAEELQNTLEIIAPWLDLALRDPKLSGKQGFVLSCQKVFDAIAFQRSAH